MPRFVSNRDFNLFQHFNRELIYNVVDVDVILYKMVLELTQLNLYGEATEKPRYTPVELKALVKYNKSITDSDAGFGVDVMQSVEFRFVRALLQQVNTFPEVGDIIYYDGGYFEIDNVVDTQYIGGQPQYATSILCYGHLTRNSALNIVEGNI
jgi:hypothetical protein